MSGCPGSVGDFGSVWGRCWGHGKIRVPGSMEVKKTRSICARTPRQNGCLLRWGLCFQGHQTRSLYHTPEWCPHGGPWTANAACICRFSSRTGEAPKSGPSPHPSTIREKWRHYALSGRSAKVPKLSSRFQRTSLFRLNLRHNPSSLSESLKKSTYTPWVR